MRRANEIRRASLVLVAALAGALFITGCAKAEAGPPWPVRHLLPVRARQPILSPEALPNAVEVLPPPPEPGSAAQANRRRVEPDGPRPAQHAALDAGDRGRRPHVPEGGGDVLVRFGCICN